MDVMNIGVVIPAYNAEKTIGHLIRELIDHGFLRDNIVVVNDGSKDKTLEVANSTGVRVVHHERNRGKGAALRQGFEVARQKHFNRVVTLDADGQHRVSEIDSLLRDKNYYDIIIGVRQNNATMPLLRRGVNRIVSLIVSLLTRQCVCDVQSGFRCINMNIFDRITLKTNNYQTESELVVKALRHGYTIGFVPISTVYDTEKSYINPVVDTARFLRMVVELLWH
jgi:glycosyltransferase involved in cell wall biosynthesis